jgi:integrase/recombinase XerD
MTDEYRLMLADFLDEMRLLGCRKQYRTGLRHRVPKFFRFLDERGLSVCQAGVREAQEYQGWLIASGRNDGGEYDNKTVLSYLGAASAFCGYVKRKGELAANPFREIRKVRADNKLPRNLLKEKELAAFLDELGRFDKSAGLKNKITRYKVHVIAELQYATGIRISEAADLTLADIDFTRNLVNIRNGKGGRSRVAILNEYAAQVLRLYVQTMRQLTFSQWNEANGELVFGVGNGWLQHVVNQTLLSVEKETGCAHVTNHSFRHALGYHLLRAGCGIRHIQQILGHRRLRNTEVYTKVDKEDLKEVLDGCHPRKWGKA